MAAPLVRRSSDDVLIRPATSADAERLRRFRCANPNEPWTNAPELSVQVEVPGWIGRPDAVILIAEFRNELVGVIAVTPQPGFPTVYLSQVLAVTYEHRRRYIGFTLKLHAMALVHERGASLMTSEVDERNAPMLACNRLFHAVAVPEPDDPTTLINTVKLTE